MKRFLLVVTCIANSACAGPEIKSDLPSEPEEPGKTIYLASHGWHAGIVIRHDDIPDTVWSEKRDFPDAEFLEVGWGDRDFYQTPDPHWAITLKAALLPTSSVLHIVGFNGSISAYFPYSEIIEIQLTESGFERLCRYIAASYAKDPAGNSVPLGTGLYGTSRFYQSSETYHLFKTCNVWTARALRTAGCPVTPAGTITVDNLMSRVRTFGKVIQPKPTRPDPSTESRPDSVTP
jgi:uncharacterized protein (TIGR02117 family)